jgi:hypothetical protein
LRIGRLRERRRLAVDAIMNKTMEDRLLRPWGVLRAMKGRREVAMPRGTAVTGAMKGCKPRARNCGDELGPGNTECCCHPVAFMIAAMVVPWLVDNYGCGLYAGAPC